MHSQLDCGDLIDPGVATQAMSKLEGKESYSGNKQQDSGEFLERLIGCVAEEEKDLLQIKPEETEVHRLFRGEEEQRVSISITSLRRIQVANSFQIICSSCRHVSTQTHDLCALTLDVPEDEKPATFETLLKNYSSTVRLPEEHKCEKCHEAGKTRQGLQITETPPYLIVMLNRTKVRIDKRYNAHYDKKKTRVPIPKGVIDLSDCCSLKEPSDKKAYAVRGVAVHIGNS